MADDRDTEDYKKIELDDLDEFDFDRRAYDSLIQEAERDLKRGEDAAPEN